MFYADLLWHYKDGELKPYPVEKLVHSEMDSLLLTTFYFHMHGKAGAKSEKYTF